MSNKKFLMLAICLVGLLSLSAICAADNATGEIVSAEETQVMEQITAEEMVCEGNVEPLQELQNNTVNPDSTLKSDGNDDDCVAVDNDDLDVQREFDDSSNPLSDGSSTGQSVGNIYGIVDLGSNVMSLSIFKEEDGGLEFLLTDNRESITATYKQDNALTQEGIGRLIELLEDFDGIMDSNNVAIKYFFATASLRKLDNCDEVVADVKNVLGIDLHVLSGEDEARAGFDAVKFLDLTSDDGLLIDIGGGSSEFVPFIDKSPVLTESMPIGSRSCYEDYVSSMFPNETEILNIQNRVELELGKLRVNNSGPIDDLYGNGGTLFTVRQTLIYLNYIDNGTYVIPSSMLDALLSKLLENTTESYQIISDVAPDRMNTLVPGIVIAIQISNHFQVKNIHFCKGRLEEGIVYELIENYTSSNGTFEELRDKINATVEGGIIYLNRNYVNDGRFSSEGINITKAITIEGNGFTIDASGFSRIFNINATKNVVLNNITFKGGLADNGGAVIFNNDISDCVISNCGFIANYAYADGGAICFKAITNVTIENATFNHNGAGGNGGAINANGDVTNTTIANSKFKDNFASCGTRNIALNGDGTFKLDNVAPKNLGPSRVALLAIINVAGNVAYGGNVEISVNVVGRLNEPLNGTVSVAINGKNRTANVENGSGKIILSGLNAGKYDVDVIYVGNDYIAVSPATFIVLKQNAVISAVSKSYVINYGGKYGITLKDADGKVLSGKKVTFTLNGKNIGSATTNAKGAATIALTAKILKAAKAGKKNLLIKFTDLNYNTSSKTVKITINKEKTKLTAKNKKFKRSVKVKKYTIALKNSKGKAINKVKVILKVKGKKYTAKTNKKGKVTFKIKKLTKKGKFNAKITFKGSKYYVKATKKVKITIK
ncbi:Ppx/GppA phosphatase family protein [Methanobrevibacter sp.]